MRDRAPATATKARDHTPRCADGREGTSESVHVGARHRALVLQTGATATAREAGTRASLYLVSLSNSLVARGFASRERDVFVPFVATILPALFLLGLFTIARLVDVAIEYNAFLTGIARIRRYYRTLSPEAEEFFRAEGGRWPERDEPPSLRLGQLIGFITTIASMVAFINSIVAGAGVALLAGKRLGGAQRGSALALRIATTAILMAAFLAYQRWRYSAW